MKMGYRGGGVTVALQHRGPLTLSNNLKERNNELK